MSSARIPAKNSGRCDKRWYDRLTASPALFEWETLSANKENRVVFEARAKELRDLLSNLEGERRLGREEGLKQVAIKLLKDGMSVEQVAKYIELPDDVIKEWVHNLE